MISAAVQGGPETPADVRSLLADPVVFSERLLGVQHLWQKQREILHAIASEPLVAVKACHASGKTFLESCAALWWPVRYADGITVTTAPTQAQVRSNLWAEIHARLEEGLIEFPTERVTEVAVHTLNKALGRATNRGIAFQGFHGGHVLVLGDEGPGLPRPLFNAIEGIRAGGVVHFAIFGNPTDPSGPYYEAFGKDRRFWKTFTISALDTPNLAGVYLELPPLIEGEAPRVYGDRSGKDLLELTEEELAWAPFPWLTTRAWVREKYEMWGPGNPLFEGRVLAEFPAFHEEALYALAWIEMAQRLLRLDDGGPVVAGVDVAGGGAAETVACIRRPGIGILAMEGWRARDPRGEVVSFLHEWRGRLRAVCVDTVGEGHYFATHLRDQKFPVLDVNVGIEPGDDERFVNLKAELAWAIRTDLQKGRCALPAGDEVLAGQLAGIRGKYDEKGRLLLEKKPEMKRRGVPSPDRFESLMLSYAASPFARTGPRTPSTPGRRFAPTGSSIRQSRDLEAM